MKLTRPGQQKCTAVPPSWESFFLDVLAHSIRQGSDGTLFRDTDDGGQDNLYNVMGCRRS
ncbi:MULTISPECIES: hypothetical protein [Myxococcus]|uniref:hypothetical protein n=1 Tax=Myxococcus TaxID=32 RepID=UPI00114251A8|nr:MULTISPECIES: hypothetical protein [Myxococcus]NOK02542.1 hypothetical protein [Myxococcus xanthus]